MAARSVFTRVKRSLMRTCSNTAVHARAFNAGTLNALSFSIMQCMNCKPIDSLENISEPGWPTPEFCLSQAGRTSVSRGAPRLSVTALHIASHRRSIRCNSNRSNSAHSKQNWTKTDTAHCDKPSFQVDPFTNGNIAQPCLGGLQPARRGNDLTLIIQPMVHQHNGWEGTISTTNNGSMGSNERLNCWLDPQRDKRCSQASAHMLSNMYGADMLTHLFPFPLD